MQNKGTTNHQDNPDQDNPDLLSLIGNRVRTLRSLRGMTRKALVVASSVSERHLAQLETGKGNISIALLERVAKALDTDLSDLVRGGRHKTIEQVLINKQLKNLSRAELKSTMEWLHTQYSDRKGVRRPIALVGLRGAGKTTLGQKLGRDRNVSFIRLVAEVEKLAGMSASIIFELSGLPGYRRLEEKALTETLSNYQDCIIETGGSLVTEPELLNILLISCTVVWIKAQPEQHMQRVIDQGDMRPMAGNDDAMSDLKRILEEREPYYSRAHHVLDTSSRSVEDCMSELKEITL